MTISLTFDPVLSRVKIDLTGQPLHADYATVERSLDGITWHTVRGGDAVPLTAGVGVAHDYEFAANVQNTYRATVVNNEPISVGTNGAGGVGVNASVTPGAPPGTTRFGDLWLLMASIRNSGAGSVNLPAGWTAIAGVGTNFLLAAREWPSIGSLTPPLVTFAGGVANADTLSVLVPLFNAALPTALPTPSQLNASAQDIATPAMSWTAPAFRIRTGWKQDDASGLSVSGYTNVVAMSVTTGDDATQAMAGAYAGTSGTDGPLSWATSGGAAAISRGAAAAFPQRVFLLQESQNITPPLDQIWLKNVSRPNLNTQVIVTDFDEVTQESRDGIFRIVGRTFPVAVTEVRASRQTMITVMTEDLSDAEDLRLRLMTGEPCFLHTPDAAGDCPIPSMYIVIGSTTQRRGEGKRRSVRRYWDLPLTEVAQPVSTFVGTTITYADVLAQFATYADILPAEPTYSDLLDRVGTPGQVIIP